MVSGGARAPALPAGRAVLAIELSQRQGSVALRAAPGGPIATRIVPPASDERDELMPAIDALVAGAGCVPGDIGVVAVSIGPGGFTGLRVAVATAKALALALGARVVAVPSALVVARSVAGVAGAAGAAGGPAVGGVLGVVLAAKGDTAWLDAVGPLHAPRVVHPAADGGLFTAEAAPLGGLAALCADDHLPASWAQRAAEAGVPIVPPVWAAEACLTEGERLLAAAGPCDPQVLAPLYPRPPEAVALWEARRQTVDAGRAG